jgi:hypothetical protein
MFWLKIVYWGPLISVTPNLRGFSGRSSSSSKLFHWKYTEDDDIFPSPFPSPYCCEAKETLFPIILPCRLRRSVRLLLERKGGNLICDQFSVQDSHRLTSVELMWQQSNPCLDFTFLDKPQKSPQAIISILIRSLTYLLSWLDPQYVKKFQWDPFLV